MVAVLVGLVTVNDAQPMQGQGGNAGFGIRISLETSTVMVRYSKSG